MKAEIFYFSGTGNSLYLAKKISYDLNAVITPIKDIINKDKIQTEADIIGIVFPVYYCEIPIIINEFLDKLQLNSNQYIFAVSNYGGSMGNSINQIKNILKKKGMKLNNYTGIHMPQNAFRKPWEKYDIIYEKSDLKIKKFSKKIIKKINKNFIVDFLEQIFPRLLYIMLKPIYIKSMRKKLNIKDENKTMYEIMKVFDNKFITTDKCNKCGLCAKVCPVHNIKITDKGPEWLHNCENCLACYNLCPKKAILGEIAHKDYYYINELTKNDLI